MYQRLQLKILSGFGKKTRHGSDAYEDIGGLIKKLIEKDRISPVVLRRELYVMQAQRLLALKEPMEFLFPLEAGNSGTYFVLARIEPRGIRRLKESRRRKREKCEENTWFNRGYHLIRIAESIEDAWRWIRRHH